MAITKDQFNRIKKQLEKLVERLENEAEEEGMDISSEEFEKVVAEMKKRVLAEKGITLEEFERMENALESGEDELADVFDKVRGKSNQKIADIEGKVNEAKEQFHEEVNRIHSNLEKQDQEFRESFNGKITAIEQALKAKPDADALEQVRNDVLSRIPHFDTEGVVFEASQRVDDTIQAHLEGTEHLTTEEVEQIAKSQLPEGIENLKRLISGENVDDLHTHNLNQTVVHGGGPSVFLAGLRVNGGKLLDGEVNLKAGSNINLKEVSGGVEIATDADTLSGPNSSTDNAIVRFDGTGGTTLQDSGVLIDDSDNITGVNQLDVDSTNGVDVNPGSDADADLITVGVTDSPTISWDESQDSFKISKGVEIDDNLAITFGTGFDATLKFDATDLLFEYDDNNTGTVSLRVQQNGTDRLTVDENGRVGVNQANPLTQLHVKNDQASLTEVRLDNTNASGSMAYTLYDGSNERGQVHYDTASALLNIGTNIATGQLSFSTGSDVEALRIDENGNIVTGVWNGTDIAVADGGTGASTASGARTNLGTNLQNVFDEGQSITIADTDNRTLSLTQNDTTNNPQALSITNAGTANAVHITQTGNTSISNSVGGALRITNTQNTGPALVIYSNQDGTQAGDLMNLRADNVAFDRSVLGISNDGTGFGVSVNATGGNGGAVTGSSSGTTHTMSSNYSGTDSASAGLSVTSTNPNFSAVSITGQEESHGTIKVSHNEPTNSDANAAALSIDLKGSTTAAQGIFVDATDGGTAGDLIDLRNNGTQMFKITADGELGVQVSSPGANFDISNAAETISAEKVIGRFGTSTLTVDTNISDQRNVQALAPTLSIDNGVTVTNAATFYVQGAPGNSGAGTLTNAYAFWVDAGATQLDGTLTVETSLSSAFPNATAGTGLVVASNDGTTQEIQRDSSTKRIKKDIEVISYNEAEKLLRIDPVSYRMQSDNQTDAGFLAEDFEDAGITDILTYDEEGKTNGFKNFGRGISAYMLAIVKQQQQEIKELREEVNSLKT